ncbi:MAG: hypothetical protein RRB13_03895 [bacterium]|nr:hypothetical protein [bacterium]
MSKSTLLFILLALFGYHNAQAEEYYQPLKSPRALAMGNTGVASANDSYALSYNPAVLANTRKWWVDYAAWTVEGSNGLTALDVLPNVAQINYPYLKEDGMVEDTRTSFLTKDQPHIRANAGINFVAQVSDAGTAIGANYLREVVMQGLEDNSLLYQRNDRITQGGFSLPLFSGSFVVGLGVRQIQRRDATSDAATVPSFGEYEQGSAYDLGILWRVPGAAHATLALAAQNIGGMDIGTATDAEPQEVHLGFNLDLDLGVMRLVPTIDIRGLSTPRERSNRIHSGLEVGLFPNETGGNWISLRGGTNEGYPTSGVEFNIGNHAIILGAARYFEEIGSSAAKVKSSERILAYFSAGF